MVEGNQLLPVLWGTEYVSASMLLIKELQMGL
jgi:hypothetical protein